MMSKQEVIDDKTAISYSSLAKFQTWGRNNPKKTEPSYAMECGKCFESMIAEGWDCVTTHYDAGSPPQRWIDALLGGDPTFPRYKKDGEIYAADIELESSVKRFIKEKDKFPIKSEDWEMCKGLAEKMLTLEVMDLKVQDYLETAEFDVPYVWVNNGIRKKCIFDIVCTAEDYDGNKLIVAFDLKTSASQGQFAQMWRSRYWIQAMHYAEGAEFYAKEMGAVEIPMLIFLVAYKDTGLVQEATIDHKSAESATNKYMDLCQDFSEWMKGGKVDTGVLPKRLMKVWNG